MECCGTGIVTPNNNYGSCFNTTQLTIHLYVKLSNPLLQLAIVNTASIIYGRLASNAAQVENWQLLHLNFNLVK